MQTSLLYDEQLDQRLFDALLNVERSLHPDVIRIRSSFGDDWSGDPAIFFKVILSDSASQQHDLAAFTAYIGSRIFDDLRLAELDYVPYFNFRIESEQKRLKDPEWD